MKIFMQAVADYTQQYFKEYDVCKSFFSFYQFIRKILNQFYSSTIAGT